MATIKSYSDLQQSKKLAEILPIESADAFYAPDTGIVIVEPYITVLNGEKNIPAYKGAIPCWSLVALLGILPNENILVKTTNGEYYCLAKDVMTAHYYNPIDACCEHILKLHELNLL